MVESNVIVTQKQPPSSPVTSEGSKECETPTKKTIHQKL